MRGLYSLRIVFAYHVLLFHYGRDNLGIALADRAPGLRAIASHGEVAPGFFLVLSGYVLTRLYGLSGHDTKWKGLLYFLTARFARLLPLSIVAWLIAFIANRGEVGFAKNYCDALVPFGMHQWIGECNQHRNAPAWAMSVEVFCYLVFAIGNCVAYRLRSTLTCLYCSALLLIISHCLCTLAGTVFYLWNPHSWLKFFPPIRLSQFIFGVCLAVFQRNLPNKIRAALEQPVLSLAALLALWSYLAVQPEFKKTGAYPFLIIGMAEFLYGFMIVGLSTTENKWLTHRVVIHLGEATYAVYILQSPIASGIGLKYLLGSWFFPTYIALCSVILVCFEQPMRNALLRCVPRSEPKKYITEQQVTYDV